jgi:hypothetical protein
MQSVLFCTAVATSMPVHSATNLSALAINDNKSYAIQPILTSSVRLVLHHFLYLSLFFQLPGIQVIYIGSISDSFSGYVVTLVLLG